MPDEVVVKLAMGIVPDPEEITSALYDICDRVHASCDDECPVYRLNGHKVPEPSSPEQHYGGCLCFKDGAAMQRFVMQHRKGG